MRVITKGKVYDTDNLTELQGRDDHHATGVALIGIYKAIDGILVVTNSIWEARDAVSIGITAHFANAEELAELAETYRGDLLDLLPEGK